MSLLRLALLALVLALFGGAATAQSYPQPTGHVVDAANVLPAGQAQALAARLEALDRQTGTQLAVVTVSSLEGRTIEDYGIGLLRAWGVGQEGRDNGAVLLVAPAERRVRIEVGYGLEPVITDALSFLVINREILPRFREGDLPGGIVAGAEALIGHLAAPPDQQQAATEAAAAERERAAERSRSGGSGGFALIFWLAILFVVVLPALAGAFGRGRRRAGPWGDRGGRRRGGDGMGIALWTLANIAANVAASSSRGGGGFGGGGGGFGGFGGGSGGGGGASGSW